ncbi:hatching enzyme 1.2-like [Halichoeres trimaculatus]|uniref:hatching enzyme 1.2-like n=1 Tax=Halichoeres trimaculatus TaxID=147232 RepID=UPI003D9DB484
MWFLIFLCVCTVGGGPLKWDDGGKIHAQAVDLNKTHHVTTLAPVGAGPRSGTHNTTSPASVGDLPSNDTNKATCPLSAGDHPLNDTHNETSTASVGNHPLNDTHNATSPASAGDLALNDTHNATSPASVGDRPLNDTHNATSVTSVGDVPTNDTQHAAHQKQGKVSLKLDPQEASAETIEELREHFVIQEGDILIPEDRNAVETLWIDAVVPYTISDELAYQTANIHAAFRMISDNTCVRFKQRTTEYNYLKFKNGNGCASFVGCRGGAQPVYFSRTCSVGNLCHEIIHALGLHHEHTRPDRDQYITVHWQSIMPGRQKNFKVRHGNTLNLPYDVNSIMHYGPHFFSVDGSPTVLPLQRGVHMGQRTHLSPLDIQRINRLYRCDERMRWY